MMQGRRTRGIPTAPDTDRSPDWKIPRERQELLAWAENLDRSVSTIRTDGVSKQTLLPIGAMDSTLVAPDVWTFFLSLTFRHSIPGHLAMNAGQRLVRWCSAWRPASGARTPLFRLLLWSAEGHVTGNVHLHALSVTTPAVSPTHCRRCRDKVSSLFASWQKLKESWFLHHGIARIRPYNPSLNFGAARYVTKYVLDESCLDWGVETW